jgi:outer membrane protein TolC
MKLINKSNLALILLGFYFLFSPHVHAQYLTLEDAVSTALKNNPKIKQYSEKSAQNKYADLEAWGNFLPKINVTASYTHLNDPLLLDLNPIRDVIIDLQSSNQAELTNIYNIIQSGSSLTAQQKTFIAQQASTQLNAAIPSFDEVFKDQNYKTATIVGVQPIFTGGKLLAAKKFASDELDASEVELRKTKDDVIQETVNNYLTVVFLQDVVKTRENVLSGMKKHEAMAEKLLQQGLIANYNMLRAKVAVADAERNLFDDNNKLELSKVALKNTLGIQEDADVQIRDSLVYGDNLGEFNSYLNKAMDEQPVLKLISLKKDAAHQKYNVEKSKFLPQAGLFGQYEMYPQYLSCVEPRWAVGLQVSLNIFNGFQDYANLQSASHLEDEVKYLEADAVRNIKLLLNKDYRNAANSKERYLKADESISLAKENLRLNERRFETGLGISLEVIDAQLSLENNEIESEQSLYDYYKSLTALNVNAGNPEEVLNIWNKVEGK